MKKTAILIGFHYPHNEHYRSLNGSLIDIYLVYKHCESIGFHTKVMGDFCIKSVTNNNAILQGYVDINILDFCGEKEDKISSLYGQTSFKTALSKALKDVGNKLLVYFSGHGDYEGKKMILPDGSGILWKEWYQWIIDAVDSSVDICFVLDCCFPPTFDLPYRLHKSRFRSKRLYEISLPRPILLFIASESKTDSSDNGSLFTRFLFQRLAELKHNHHLCISLDSIKKFVDTSIKHSQKKRDPQRMSIYASYSHSTHLPPWLWTFEIAE